jgi:hypothetical protein
MALAIETPVTLRSWARQWSPSEPMIVVPANALQMTAMETRLTFDLNDLCVGFMNRPC